MKLPRVYLLVLTLGLTPYFKWLTSSLISSTMFLQVAHSYF